MRAAVRWLIHPFLLPGGLVLVAAAAAAGWNAPPALQPYLRYAPPLVLGFGLFLGWRFHRSRLVVGLVLLATAERLVGTVGGGPAGRFAVDALAVALPLNLVAFARLGERRLGSLRGGARLLGITVQVVAFGGWYLRQGATAVAWLEAPLFGGLSAFSLPLPQPALAAYLVAAALLLAPVGRRPTSVDTGFFWALAASFFALAAGPGATPAIGLFTAGAVALELSVLEAAYAMAFRDELTGLPARRALNEALAQVCGRYTLAMVDIDHFKKVNDRLGHDVGDQVLQRVAARLARVGGGGRAYRYGGEEFTVCFPGSSLAEALPHLEDLRQAVAAAPFIVRGRRRPRRRPAHPKRTGRTTLKVTVSIGAAESRARGTRTPPPEVIRAADRALYRAKRGGRDQVRS